MSTAVAVRRRASVASRPALLLAAAFAGAALVAGFTIARGIDPFDEGLALQAAQRVSEGQVPYRDFLWGYGPGGPYALAALRDLFGPSLLDWRLLQVLVVAAIATTVLALVRRETGNLPLSLTGWLLAACALSEPRTANPFAYALLPALLAFAIVTGGVKQDESDGAAVGSGPGHPEGSAVSATRAAAAGALLGLAAAFRVDFAVFGLTSVLVALTLRGERRALAVCTGAAVATTLLLYAPFLVAIGPADLYDALVGTSLRERAYWTLPFPLMYPGSIGDLSDLKHALAYYRPLVAVVGVLLAAAAVALRWRGSRRVTSVAAGLLVLCGGFVVYLRSRTDAFHAEPLEVTLAALLPVAIVAARRTRVLAVALTMVLGVLMLNPVAGRVRALVAPGPMATVQLPAADGVKAPPDEARALEQALGLVRATVPPGAPIYVLPRRSDLVRISAPILYVLADRDNPTPRDHGLLTAAAAQRAIVTTLARVRPLAIVRWTDPISSEREPNLRGRPSGVTLLDGWVAREYVLRARFGHYDVLVPRGS